MSERTRRFNTRQEVRRDKTAGNGVLPVAEAEAVKLLNESDIDQSRLDKERADRDAYYTVKTNTKVEEVEVRALLEDIRGQIRTHHIDEILESAKQNTVHNVINQFGVGKILTREFADIVEYRRRDYVDSGVKTNMRQVRQGSDRDSYTAQKINNPEADHVFSLKEFHESEGWWLSRQRKTDFAADLGNLVATDQGINRSKGSGSLSEFEERWNSGSQDQPRIDGRHTRPLKKRAHEAVTEHAASSWDKAKFVTLRGAEASVRMGLQQALGVVLHEVTVALFEEAKDIYRQGLQVLGESFWEALKRRAGRILRHVKDKWKDVLVAFGEGMLSGFLSLLVEVLLKALKGLAKRTGRLIRESVHSLHNAVKLLLFPPEGTSLAEAAHEATKILSAAAIAAIGLTAEQAAEELLRPLLGPFSSLVVPVLLGILTGLGAAFLAYGLDKLDIFGVQEARVREGVFEELATRRKTTLEEMDETLDFFLTPILPDRSR